MVKDKPGDEWPAEGFKGSTMAASKKVEHFYDPTVERFKQMQAEKPSIPIVKAFDFDGVINLGVLGIGVRPGPFDVIITGRSFQEAWYVQEFLTRYKIEAPVFYNPTPFAKKTREGSGQHKARTVQKLKDEGVVIEAFFEDDPVQVAELKSACHWLRIVQMVHDITEK